jgi:ribonuclease BN (tRNA processing enzyme)
MELIALGTYGPYPKAGTATSGYLLKISERYYLFDMGSGVYARLDQIVQDLDILKAIFLTHLHFDHISDVSIFKYAAGFKKDRGLMHLTPQIYHPKTPVSASESLIHGQVFDLHPIDQTTVYEEDGVKITFSPMRHPVETYGVRVEAEGKVFAYTSDTAYHDNLITFVYGADLLVINCGYQNIDKPTNPNHLTTEEVVEIVRQGQVKRALATHLFAEHDQEAHRQEMEAYGVTALSMIEEMKWYQI